MKLLDAPAHKDQECTKFTNRMCLAVLILLMIGSAQHELAKFLATLLQPVLELYSTNCINDSFSFTKMIQQLKVNSNDFILCSFDICSLFTNIPLAETIEICTETLYDSHLPTPVILNMFLLN